MAISKCPLMSDANGNYILCQQEDCAWYLKNYKSCCNNHDKNLWFYYSSYWNEVKWNITSCLYVTLLVVYLLIALIEVPTIIGETLKWAFVPEVKYLELLKGYIQ